VGVPGVCGATAGSTSSSSGGGASSTGSGSVKFRCGEIGSWDKAHLLLKQGHTYLDRNGDWKARELLM